MDVVNVINNNKLKMSPWVKHGLSQLPLPLPHPLHEYRPCPKHGLSQHDMNIAFDAGQVGHENIFFGGLVGQDV